MQARDERERLVGALADLRAELGWEDHLAAHPAMAPTPRSGSLLEPEDEAQIQELGRSLAMLATAAASAHPPDEPLPESVTQGSVGGAEWVMRSVLEGDDRKRLRELLPDFVYLVTLPYLDQEEALRLARRTRELLSAGSRDE
jgi:hypothetical protein